MTERDIQIGIYEDLLNRGSSAKVSVPNYTPDPWWECDVWAVTLAGYSVEYEIKLSIRDFKADAAKSKMWREPGQKYGERQKRTKHSLMGNPLGPSRFFFVVPEEIEADAAAILPSWAGLAIAVDLGRHGVRVRGRMAAPHLHRVKVSNATIQQAYHRLVYRYWNAVGAGHNPTPETDGIADNLENTELFT